MQNNKFEDLQVPDIPRQTIHLEWDDLRDMVNEILCRLLGRELNADAERSDYYDWNFALIDGSLSPEELEMLFSTIEADDWDRESNEFYGDPIQSLSQSLSRKLVSLLLPFSAVSAHADDEGVWFIGDYNFPKAALKPILPDEMPTNRKTLFKLISGSIAYENKAFEDEVYRKGISELWKNLYITNIFKEVASMAEDGLELYFNPKVDKEEFKIIYDLAKRGVFTKTIHEWAYGLENLDISTNDAIAQLIQDYCTDILKPEE